MSAGRADEHQRRHDEQDAPAERAPMRSPVNWAVLGLLIERPTYVYELAHRFERRYGDALHLSNIGHAYTAIGALESRGLIVEIPGTREGRQPKPRYRATDAGRSAYREWLVTLAQEESRRRRLSVLALGALAESPAQMLDALADCETVWLRDGMATDIAAASLQPTEPSLSARLIAEQERLAIGAKLEWVQFAREQVGRLASTGAPTTSPRPTEAAR
jgi:DNA-binding PadR family transcriptional regulator